MGLAMTWCDDYWAGWLTRLALMVDGLDDFLTLNAHSGPFKVPF